MWCVYGCLAFLSFSKFCRLCTSRPELVSSLGSDATQGREKESAEGTLRMRGNGLTKSLQERTGRRTLLWQWKTCCAHPAPDSPNSRVEFACLDTSIWMINGLNLLSCHLIPPALDAMMSDLDSQPFQTPRSLWGWAHMECCNFLDRILFICSPKVAVRTADLLGTHLLDDYWIAVS